MNLLDRYLLGQFFRNLALVMSTLVAIYLLVDFFERIDNFLEMNKSLGLVLRYFALKIPLILEQLMPICILLAGVLTLGMLNHRRELVALKTGGIHLLRIIRPLTLGAVIITLLTLASSQWLLPAALATTNRIWYEEVQNRIPKGIDRSGRIYYKGEEGIYTFKRPDPEADTYTDFAYGVWDDQYQLDLFLAARRAEWHQGRWLLSDGQIKRRNGEDYRIELFGEQRFTLPEQPGDFFIPPYKKLEKSLLELFQAARREGFDKMSEPWLTLQRRLSYIFLGLPLFLVGLPMLLIAHQKWQRDLTLAIPISCGLAFGAWGWWSTMQSLATATYLNPVTASWSIHLLAGSLGVWLLKRQKEG